MNYPECRWNNLSTCYNFDCPIIFLSITDWKKWLLILYEILSFGATEECHVNNASTAMILTYCLLIGWLDFSFLLALLCTQLISGGCQFQAKNNHHLAWFSSAVCYYPCKHVIYKSFFTLKKGRKQKSICRGILITIIHWIKSLGLLR